MTLHQTVSHIRVFYYTPIINYHQHLIHHKSIKNLKYNQEYYLNQI
jgi:hypothetical protein